MMTVSLFRLALVLTSLLCSTRAFSVVSRANVAPALFSSPVPRGSPRFMSDDGGEAPVSSRKRKRRVRRKAVVEEEAKEEIPELKPRKDSAVSMEVKDIRDLVGGGGGGRSTTPASSAAPPSEATVAAPSASAKTQSSSASSSSSNSSSSSSSTETSSGSLDDSLEQLLADAQELKALEKSDNDDDGVSSEGGAMSTVRNVISTVVTVDFFVVCAFLLWFLAGVFSSYVLQDDTIQIAFNSNFQLLVQPALGILMIAAIADAVTKGKDEEEA